MEFHEAANIFPLDEEHLQDLADDIRVHGQQVPVEVCDGKILDGRRRWKACALAGVEPKIVAVTPADPVAYVLSLNLHRRQLTPSQRSMCAARARDMYDRRAKERQMAGQQAGGKARHGSMVENLPPCITARDAAGKAFGVSGKSVDYAQRVIGRGTPELVRAVDEGRMAVSTAAILASETPEVQVEEATKARRNRTYQSVSRATTNGGHNPDPIPTGSVRGMGIQRAHEAIACLKQIPKNDALRKRGFQVVTDWIKHNP